MNPAEDFKQWRDYMQDIAANHKDIRHTAADKHFCMMYLEEVLTRTSLEFERICMIAEYPDFSTYNESHDNNFLRFEGGISIIKFFESGNFEQYLTVTSECLVIAKDIIKKIFKDYAACREDQDADPNLNMFQTTGIKGMKIGPVFGSWAGVRFVPVLGNPDDLNNYDASKWLYS